MLNIRAFPWLGGRFSVRLAYRRNLCLHSGGRHCHSIEEKGEEKTYRLITDLMDITAFPALLLAQEYHQRWEVENTLDEFKTHLNGRKNTHPV